MFKRSQLVLLECTLLIVAFISCPVLNQGQAESTSFVNQSGDFRRGACREADFAAGVHYRLDEWPRIAAVGDFNGDGNSDLAVTNQLSNDVSILLGDGTGQFSQKEFPRGAWCVFIRHGRL